MCFRLATTEVLSKLVRALEGHDIRLHCRVKLNLPIHSNQSPTQSLDYLPHPVLLSTQHQTTITMRFSVIVLPVLAAGAAAQSS